MEWLGIIGSGTAVFLATLGLAHLTRSVATERSFLEFPNELSSHTAPVPLGGGIPVTLLLLAAIGGGYAARLLSPELALALAPPIGLIAVVNLADDWRGLHRWWRVTAHVASALWFLWWAGPAFELDIAGLTTLSLGDMGWPLCLLWLSYITGAFKRLDKVDGLAGIQVLLFGCTVAGIGFLEQSYPLGILGVTLVATSAGFLWSNWHPASLFLGGTGLAPLGFVVAASCVLVAAETPAATVALLASIWLFLTDAIVAGLRRILHAEEFAPPPTPSLYQRLALAGWRHDEIAILYFFLAGPVAGAGVYLYASPTLPAWMLGVGMLATSAIILFAVATAEYLARRRSIAEHADLEAQSPSFSARITRERALRAADASLKGRDAEHASPPADAHAGGVAHAPPPERPARRKLPPPPPKLRR